LSCRQIWWPSPTKASNERAPIAKGSFDHLVGVD
jgi:hypothetical protein